MRAKKWWEKWEKWETISESLDLSRFQEIIAAEKSGKLVGKSQKKWEKTPEIKKRKSEMLKKAKKNITGSLVTYGPEYSQAFGVEKVATILSEIALDKKYITLTDYQGRYDEDNKLYTVKSVKHIMVSQIIRIEEEARDQYYEIRENGIETGKMVEVAPGVFERTGEEAKQEEGTDNG